MKRTDDWLRQAKADLDFAIEALKTNHFNWVCVIAQQATENAIKAIFQELTAEAWGHATAVLLKRLPDDLGVSNELIEDAKILDKYYIPARYPNGLISGAPIDAFVKKEANEAIKIAKEIINFCENTISTLKTKSTTDN